MSNKKIKQKFSLSLFIICIYKEEEDESSCRREHCRHIDKLHLNYVSIMIHLVEGSDDFDAINIFLCGKEESDES